MKIEVYLVNGTSHTPYEISAKEFSDRIIGDDWGPPVDSWGLKFIDDAGQEFVLGVDPRDRSFEVNLSYGPIGMDEPAPSPEVPSHKQDWIAARIAFLLEEAAAVIPMLHASQRAVVREQLHAIANEVAL